MIRIVVEEQYGVSGPNAPTPHAHYLTFDVEAPDLEACLADPQLSEIRAVIGAEVRARGSTDRTLPPGAPTEEEGRAILADLDRAAANGREAKWRGGA